jgi:hypothetical protein
MQDKQVSRKIAGGAGYAGGSFSFHRVIKKLDNA